MNNTNDESDLMWSAINVLQSIVKQGLFQTSPLSILQMRDSNLNNCQFTLILIKLLKDQLPLDRKIKILKLLQVNSNTYL